MLWVRLLTSWFGFFNGADGDVAKLDWAKPVVLFLS